MTEFNHGDYIQDLDVKETLSPLFGTFIQMRNGDAMYFVDRVNSHPFWHDKFLGYTDGCFSVPVRYLRLIRSASVAEIEQDASYYQAITGE